MAVIADWHDDEHSIIRKTYGARWTWDEMRAANEQINAMVETVEGRVDVIVMFAPNTMALPGNLLDMTRQTAAGLHERIALVLVVGGAFLRDIMEILWFNSREMAERYGFTYSLDHALELIDLSRRGGQIPPQHRAPHHFN